MLHRLSELTRSCTFVPVTVQCIRDGQFVVVVSRAVTLPRLSLDSVHLLGGNDPPCGPVESTPSFAIYQFPVTTCGTNDGEHLHLVLFCFVGIQSIISCISIPRRTVDMWCMRIK